LMDTTKMQKYCVTLHLLASARFLGLRGLCYFGDFIPFGDFNWLGTSLALLACGTSLR
jgi:hypothetical protein